MSNNKLNLHEILSTALKLFIITAITCVSLCLVNSVTQPIAEQLESEKVMDSVRALINEESYTIDEVDGFSDESIEKIYKISSTNDGSLICYCIKSSEKGYGGAINLMVRVNASGSIGGVKVISASETPGIGQKALEPAFLDRFNGKSGSVALGEGGLTALTGATITSKAVTKSINHVLEVFDMLKEAETNEIN